MSAGLISPIMMGALIAALLYYATIIIVSYFVIRLAVTSGVIKAEKKMAANHVSSKK